jgi:cell division initiation protein
MDHKTPTISPSELRAREFARKVRGYDPDEVDELLGLAADSLERAVVQIDLLTRDVRRLEERVGKFEEMESTIKDTLVSTQGSVDEIRKNAEKEAELIRREAQVEAATELELSQRKVEEVRVQIDRLKTIRDDYFARVKALIESHRELIEKTEADFGSPDSKPDQKNGVQENEAGYNI